MPPPVVPPLPPRPGAEDNVYINYAAIRNSAPELRNGSHEDFPATRFSAPESSDIYGNLSNETSENVYDVAVDTPNRKERKKSSSNKADYEEPVSFLYNQSQSSPDDKEPVIPYDVFFDGQKVFGLDEETFHNFVKYKDLSMIMFYDPLDPRTDTPKANFKKAARRDDSDKFAAVDCNRYPDLCSSLKINVLPMLKVYSMGKVFGTIRDMSQFDDKAMIQHMNTLYDMIDTTKDNSYAPRLPEVTKPKCTLAKIFGFKK